MVVCELSSSLSNTEALEQQILALQEEVGLLRKKNSDLDERFKAYSSINSEQISLINKLIGKVPFGVMFLSEEQRITHANDAAGKILSMQPSKLEGMNSCDFFAEEGVLHAGSNKIKTSLLTNGKYVMHSAFKSNEGSEEIVVEAFVDISEIKQAEQELLKINQVKDDFLGMISHELRSPLNVINGYSSLLEDQVKKLKNEDATSYVEHIIQAGEMLLQVVSNLLELSELTAGKIESDNIPIDLEMVITQLRYRLEKSFANENNKLIVECEDVPLFEQDLGLLMKVLYELLFNANKFTEAGVVTISIFMKKRDQQPWLHFKISDTGCGMTEETIKQIFYAFHQADSSMSRAYQGLGLGLSLVEKIMKVINGVIEVESEIDVGSTFTVSFPYQSGSYA